MPNASKLYGLKFAVFHSPLAIISAVSSVAAFSIFVVNFEPFVRIYLGKYNIDITKECPLMSNFLKKFFSDNCVRAVCDIPFYGFFFYEFSFLVFG